MAAATPTAAVTRVVLEGKVGAIRVGALGWNTETFVPRAAWACGREDMAAPAASAAATLAASAAAFATTTAAVASANDVSAAATSTCASACASVLASAAAAVATNLGRPRAVGHIAARNGDLGGK